MLSEVQTMYWPFQKKKERKKERSVTSDAGRDNPVHSIIWFVFGKMATEFDSNM